MNLLRLYPLTLLQIVTSLIAWISVILTQILQVHQKIKVKLGRCLGLSKPLQKKWILLLFILCKRLMWLVLVCGCCILTFQFSNFSFIVDGKYLLPLSLSEGGDHCSPQNSQSKMDSFPSQYYIAIASRSNTITGLSRLHLDFVQT